MLLLAIDAKKKKKVFEGSSMAKVIYIVENVDNSEHIYDADD